MSSGPNGHPRDLLSEYLDDELGLEDRASVDRHLAGCEDCREELDALRRLARAFAEETVPPVPIDLEARIGRRLDAAKVVRPLPWRFAVPATIAATLGAIGLLVVLQWRGEGRMNVPSSPAPPPEPSVRTLGEASRANAPTPPAVPEEALTPQTEKEAPRRDALEKDLAASPEQKWKRDAESVAAGASGGVVGGVVGGVAGGVEGGTAGDAEGQVPPADERRERAASKLVKDSAGFAQSAPAAPAVPAAKSEEVSSCLDRWSDSGLRGSWEVPDVKAAERQLGRIAHAVSGIGLWRGVADGRPYVVVVPRARFEEVVYALRARGVTGFPETLPLAEGTDCAGISVSLTVVSAAGSPPPR